MTHVLSRSVSCACQIDYCPLCCICRRRLSSGASVPDGTASGLLALLEALQHWTTDAEACKLLEVQYPHFLSLTYTFFFAAAVCCGAVHFGRACIPPAVAPHVTVALCLSTLQGAKLCQLLACCAALRVRLPPPVAAAWMRELARDSGAKMPVKQPELLAALVWGVATLQAAEAAGIGNHASAFGAAAGAGAGGGAGARGGSSGVHPVARAFSAPAAAAAAHATGGWDVKAPAGWGQSATSAQEAGAGSSGSHAASGSAAMPPSAPPAASSETFITRWLQPLDRAVALDASDADTPTKAGHSAPVSVPSPLLPSKHRGLRQPQPQCGSIAEAVAVSDVWPQLRLAVCACLDAAETGSGGRFTLAGNPVFHRWPLPVLHYSVLQVSSNIDKHSLTAQLLLDSTWW